MGQRLTITESEKNRIKGLYEQAKKPFQIKPKGEKIPTIQIKVGGSPLNAPLLCDLTMMHKRTKGASFYGKHRGTENYFEVSFECGSRLITFISVKHNEPYASFDKREVSPQALQLLNKAAGCDSYVSNQDTSSDMV
jgi:hypothetical protein